MPRQPRNHDEWIVHGRKPGQPWLIVVFFVAIGVLVVLAYQRFMAFDTVTYELRACQSPLTVESTWSEVEAAGCEPTEPGEVQVVLYEGTSRHEPATVDRAVFSFDRFPVNSTLHSVEIDGTPPTGAVLIAEPTNETIRQSMSGNVQGTTWSGFVGDRGPTQYWLLMTPNEE
ncbi:MAG: hypothetical protein ABR500_14075 [Dermatophilaceae bacterium]|nr:hypothetical protein [Intrasporangiaceae bacterium]